MTIKELIPKLIEHYEKCIDEMPEEGWHTYLLEENVLFGICFCSLHKFQTRLSSNFIDDFTMGNYYLCAISYSANSYSEAKELLQIRLHRLKEFL